MAEESSFSWVDLWSKMMTLHTLAIEKKESHRALGKQNASNAWLLLSTPRTGSLERFPDLGHAQARNHPQGNFVPTWVHRYRSVISSNGLLENVAE